MRDRKILVIAAMLGAVFSTAAGMIPSAFPNVELPPQVRAETGKITLFADYANPADGKIPLYVVNRTPQEILLPAQGGDLYIKLERQLPSGEWQRVQTHRFSDCGNSYMSLSLKPGMHLRISGYAPADGTSATVRYASYSSHEIVSNTGRGFVDETEAVNAEDDDLAMRSLPGSALEYFRTTRFDMAKPPSERIAAFRLSVLWGENKKVRSAAERWIGTLEGQNPRTPEEEQALVVGKEILSRNWGEKAGNGAVLAACHEVLKSPPGERSFGSPSVHRQMVWAFVKDIAETEFGKLAGNRYEKAGSHEVWKELCALSAKELRVLPAGNHRAPAMLFGIAGLVDEAVPDQTLESLLDLSLYPECKGAAEALVRRGKLSRLAELSPSLKPENRLLLFSILAPALQQQSVDPRSREAAYWRRMMEERPLAASAALISSTNLGYSYSNRFDRRDFEPLFAVLKKEAASAADGSSDYELSGELAELPGAIRFVSTWKDREDLPLFGSLHSHRGYVMAEDLIEEDGKLVAKQVKRLPVQFAASAALETLGHPVEGK